MRIIAGQWRGRRLRVPPGEQVRPTQGKVREALFARLGERVPGAVVLDLFAGSGALGLEALSRGAESVTFVERARPALQALRRNIEELKAEDRSVVIAADVFAFLDQRVGVPTGVTLLLADPPYGTLPGELLARLAVAGCMAWGPRPLMVIESGDADGLLPPAPGWVRWPARTYGETRITIDEREGER